MTLEPPDHKSLVVWAAECAEHVLPNFEKKYPNDDRPRRAVEAGRAWVRGEMALGEVRGAAFAAHSAARAATDAAARAAARAAGHAAATAHVPGHAARASAYAAAAAAGAAGGERAWQLRRLPDHLRPVVFPARRRE
jgi:hypothetical protein